MSEVSVISNTAGLPIKNLIMCSTFSTPKTKRPHAEIPNPSPARERGEHDGLVGRQVHAGDLALGNAQRRRVALLLTGRFHCLTSYLRSVRVAFCWLNTA